MTQIGFVTMVLLAPATMDDQKLTTMVLPGNCQQSLLTPTTTLGKARE